MSGSSIVLDMHELSPIQKMSVYFGSEHEPGTSVPWTFGEDHDHFVRAENGWRLSARRWVALFERPAPEPSH
jgi:hypothetical protein